MRVKIKSNTKRISAYPQRLAKAIKILSFEAFTRIQSKTPVDTGRARSAWRINRVSDYRYLISNNMPYIVRLENGYSRQAPRGMVGPTLKELKPLVSQLAKI